RARAPARGVCRAADGRDSSSSDESCRYRRASQGEAPRGRLCGIRDGSPWGRSIAAGGLLVTPEGAPSPVRQNRQGFGTPIRLEHGGDDKQAAEDGVAVVARQFDEPCLLHQTAQFDQVAGAGAPRVLTLLM